MRIDKNVELLAAACHSAWYAYTVLALGEQGKPWSSAPDWQKESMMNAVQFWDVECAAFPEGMPLEEKVKTLAPLSHENWMEYKKDEGWVYGETKDPEKKTHPCLVPYDKLPHDQKVKDIVVLHAYLALRPLV